MAEDNLKNLAFGYGDTNARRNDASEEEEEKGEEKLNSVQSSGARFNGVSNHALDKEKNSESVLDPLFPNDAVLQPKKNNIKSEKTTSDWDNDDLTVKEKRGKTQKRVLNTRKNLRAFKKCIELLEERIAVMEARWSNMDKKQADQESDEIESEENSSKSGDADDRSDTNAQGNNSASGTKCTFKCAQARAEVLPHLWNTYIALKESDSEDTKAAIDILLSARQSKKGRTRPSLRKSQRTQQSQVELVKGAVPLKSVVDNTKGCRMPNQIRINSKALAAVLRAIIDPDGDNLEAYGPLIIRAPYKPLIHYGPDIRKLLDALRVAEEQSSEHNGGPEGAFAHSTGISHVFSDDEIACTTPRLVEDGEDHSGHTQGNSRADLPSSQKSVYTEENLNKPMAEELAKKTKEVTAVHESPYHQVLRNMGFPLSSLECPSCTGSVLPHLQCLVEFMDIWLEPIVQRLRNRTIKKVRFVDLWHLYQPGDLVVERRPKAKTFAEMSHRLCMKVLRTTGGNWSKSGRAEFPDADIQDDDDDDDDAIEHNDRSTFYIEAYYVDYDGSKFVPATRLFQINPFHGERPILDLELTPADPHENNDSNIRNMTERGALFASYVPKTKHMLCKGFDLETQDEIDGPVMVDISEYYRYAASEKIFPPNFVRPERYLCPAAEIDDIDMCPCGAIQCEMEHRSAYRSIYDEPHLISGKALADQFLDDLRMEEYMKTQTLFKSRPSQDNEQDALHPSEYVICHYRAFVYVLRSRKWAQVYVGDLNETKEAVTGSPFEKLVLPDNHRHLILSQVEQHFRQRSFSGKHRQDDLDFVQGKGKGLIILLHGPPGVGKTSTAETIAHSFNRPLLPITCGDLGSKASEVEKNLQLHFKLAGQWGCVMLLDEADVFLSQRDRDDYQRNSIVSVFLRMLEYYTGLLFLTSNRVGTFDEAFKSRIHIILYYEPFDKETTLKVWKSFIAHAVSQMKLREDIKFRIDKNEILEFALQHFRKDKNARWNGRQIRNAFQSALAMAEYDALHPDSSSSTDTESSHEETHENRDKAKIQQKILEVRLGRKQFEVIAQTMASFDKYVRETIGMTFEQKAFVEKLRSDPDILMRIRDSDYLNPLARMDRLNRSMKSEIERRHNDGKKGAATDSEEEPVCRKSKNRKVKESSDLEDDGILATNSGKRRPKKQKEEHSGDSSMDSEDEKKQSTKSMSKKTKSSLEKDDYNKSAQS
ncbi:uncharacterized protein PV09_02895 [Verruconis gallopava]|uniref:AAA+ ATPase domain-containing protein n=1 Tax=Verruconis gallopava TaxID=253628 RepID=A0A0D1XUN2_9PEZI|nr:uncharacterized protein PV09_02895 [Verruconis gallopava]KIW06451.1 hypothetical protein PV09_02895 [Verruconis gallopava]